MGRRYQIDNGGLTVKIGIDKLAFATTPYYLTMEDLAQGRGEDPNKYLIGIGQDRQAVVPPTQDVVTLAAAAGEKLLTNEERDQVSTIIVATESGIDNSKATAIYVKRLLKLNDFTRAVEIKEACYSATAAIQFARGLIALKPQEKVLVIASDVARYGLNTGGEVTQGAGAVAMLITANPRVLAIEETSVAYAKDVMDFWRPLYSEEAMVDGKYSTNVYIDFFKQTWTRYQQLTGQTLADFTALAFHLPFTKMGKKALEAELGERDDTIATRMRANLKAEQAACRQVGNLYTGSLYLGLMSLLVNGDVQPGERIGLFSYGSGSEGEFYAGILQSGYQAGLGDLSEQLAARKRVDLATYEKNFNAQLGLKEEDVTFETPTDGQRFILAGQKNHQRQYVDLNED
jgi:hydroxymethylglutaryl-CoA synthase